MKKMIGGDEEDRTPGLGIANAALSQLSYIPGIGILMIRSPVESCQAFAASAADFNLSSASLVW